MQLVHHRRQFAPPAFDACNPRHRMIVGDAVADLRTIGVRLLPKARTGSSLSKMLSAKGPRGRFIGLGHHRPHKSSTWYSSTQTLCAWG